MFTLKREISCLNKNSTLTGLLNDIYILSAVRTPVGLVNGFLDQCTLPQLGASALKEALERARIPFKDVENVFMGCAFQNCVGEEENVQQLSRLAGLPKSAVCTVVNSACTSGIKSLVLACQFLETSGKDVCAAGGMESISNELSLKEQCPPEVFFDTENTQKKFKLKVDNYLKNHNFNQEDQNKYVLQDYKNFLKAYSCGAFQDEICKLIFRRRGQQTTIAEDETFKQSQTRPNPSLENFVDKSTPLPGDGAAAFVLATGNYLKKYHLTPLAKVISFADGLVSSNDFLLTPVDAIKQVLKVANFSPDQISQWEINDFYSGICLACMKDLSINRFLLNKDGGSLSLGYPTGMSGARMVCHLAHSLSAGESGCAAACNTNGQASAVVIQKASLDAPGIPRLTLYTKNSCQLCDELKEQLKPFEGQFSLEEVDIEAEENARFKKLYRYEIPVLFLNGRFLCKHKLDEEHFRRRLARS